MYIGVLCMYTHMACVYGYMCECITCVLIPLSLYMFGCMLLRFRLVRAIWTQ